MAAISSSLTSYLYGLLTSDTGVNSYILAGPAFTEVSGCTPVSAVRIQHASADLAEKGQQIQYPCLFVYCAKLINTSKEKFAVFSGTAKLIIEVRCSRDRIDHLESQLERYVDATCAVLESAKGTWQSGAFYTGGYEVSFGAVTRGGQLFLQTAEVGFVVHISL